MKAKTPIVGSLILAALLAGCGSAGLQADPAVGDTSDMVQRPSGLLVKVIKHTNGPMAIPGETLVVNYIGTLANGTVFDSSVAPGRQPFTFTLGRGQVVEGWEEGLDGMHVGEQRKLIIPPALGYGSKGQGPIPPNATLVFQVELLGIK